MKWTLWCKERELRVWQNIIYIVTLAWQEDTSLFRTNNEFHVHSAKRDTTSHITYSISKNKQNKKKTCFSASNIKLRKTSFSNYISMSKYALPVISDMIVLQDTIISQLRPVQHHHQLLPLRVCCSQLCAMPVQHVRATKQAQEDISPIKNKCDKQVSSWRHINCHTDKNRYYTWS